MKVSVIGGGTMGNGIAQVFAQCGHDVNLIDVKQEFLDRAMGTIEKNLGRMVKKETLSEADAQATLGRLHPVVGLDNAADSDLVVEAVFESFAVKKEIFTKLDPRTMPDGPQSVTSTFDDALFPAACITNRDGTRRPGRCPGQGC